MDDLYRLRQMLARIWQRAVHIGFVCRALRWCGGFGSGFSGCLPAFFAEVLPGSGERVFSQRRVYAILLQEDCNAAVRYFVEPGGGSAERCRIFCMVHGQDENAIRSRQMPCPARFERNFFARTMICDATKKFRRSFSRNQKKSSVLIKKRGGRIFPGGGKIF